MFKKYTWLFPFLSGIVSLIGLLTPVAVFYNYFNIWMWGLVYSRFSGISVEFIHEQPILITGISSSITITLFSIILIITGFFYKKGYFTNSKVSILWISCGIIILICSIISLVSLDFYTYEGYFVSGIWSICNPGFGAIGPILGGVLSIGTGILASKSIIGRIEKPIPISAFAPKKICPYCNNPVSLNATFCSKCGRTLEPEI